MSLLDPANPLAVRPDTDPEILYVMDRLKALKSKCFFGRVEIHLEDGIALRVVTEESVRIPMKHLPAEAIARLRKRSSAG